MKYNLSIDSGGSSTIAVVYDDGLRRVGAVRTGSVRENTTSAGLIARHIEELIDGLRETGLTEVGILGGLCPGSILSAIRHAFPVGQRLYSGESELGLSAALIDGDGILILCGTGCSYFSRINGRVNGWGGYGAAVGDFGSGYDIGRRALEFAIADYEGRGSPTALTGMICRRFDRMNLKDALFSIYGAGFPLSPAAAVASIKPVVDDAAEIGDAAAISVLRDAGRIVGSGCLPFTGPSGCRLTFP
ncbi:MAG: BadF/BadG/BcrA/BcrD ATPase family protein [Eubacteriales bacterium]|nr:BadF/BadG/BcrA/BcrD ATPase family protein [Eubacteriales bacterium]